MFTLIQISIILSLPKRLKATASATRKRLIVFNLTFCFNQYNQGIGGVDLLDRFISQYRPTIQAKKWYWPLFVNCIEMLTVAAWRLHVSLLCKLRRILALDFIQSVVAGLLKNTSSLSSGPSGRRIMNKIVGSHHPVNAESQGRCVNCKKNIVKNVKNVVFACILCASLITTSDKIV